MKKIRNYLGLFLLVILIATSSCTKGDLNKPMIELVSPTNSSTVKIGEALNLEIIFTDDVGLQAYDLDIHWGEDHGDHSYVGAETRTTLSTFKYKEAFSLRGKKDHIKRSDIVIDKGVRPGRYHVGITCVDVNGNSSVVWLNNLRLVNE